MSESRVYVDLNALDEWQKQLTSINNNAVEILENFDSTIKDMETIWSGNSADGFYNSVSKMVSSAKCNHEKMSDVNNLLNNIAETIKKQ